MLGIERPRVGLLSNGSEAQRGSQLVLETHARLAAQCAGSEALVFVGNVEGSGLTQGSPTSSSPTASPATSR